MTHWRLTAKPNVVCPGKIDASILNPRQLEHVAELSHLVIECQFGGVAVGDLFEISKKDQKQSYLEIDPGDFILDRVGAAADGQRLGLSGGCIRVGGHVGDLVGHRMRRGVILIDGDVGTHCGGSMIAGTIIVAGRVGASVFDAARRGTLITSDKPSISSQRFTRGVGVDCLYAAILDRSLPEGPCQELCRRIADRGGFVSLGDQSVDGKAEIFWPR